MACSRDKIEKNHWSWEWKNSPNNKKPWQQDSKGSSWLKRQMSKYLRRLNKNIEEDEQGYKSNRKPTKGYQY